MPPSACVQTGLPSVRRKPAKVPSPLGTTTRPWSIAKDAMTPPAACRYHSSRPSVARNA
jgi:hypothetical protein